jgi:hypothetical protein
MVFYLFEVDKAGDDVLNRDYSMVVVVNQKEVYGFRAPQAIQKALKEEFNKKLLNINRQKRFKIRFHTSIIILLLREAIKRKKIENSRIEICNDIDGHIHEIKDMIFKNISKDLPSLKKENIISAKFPKLALVNVSAKSFYKKDKEKLKDYNISNFKLKDLRELIKKSGNQG